MQSTQHFHKVQRWPLTHVKLRFCAGIECDISVASGAARFKSTVLRYLADIDPRFSSLVRLVKLWAGAHGMNDAASGTFNSFALTLMVCHHSSLLFNSHPFTAPLPPLPPYPPPLLPCPALLMTSFLFVGQLCYFCVVTTTWLMSSHHPASQAHTPPFSPDALTTLSFLGCCSQMMSYLC